MNKPHSHCSPSNQPRTPVRRPSSEAAAWGRIKQYRWSLVVLVVGVIVLMPLPHSASATVQSSCTCTANNPPGLVYPVVDWQAANMGVLPQTYGYVTSGGDAFNVTVGNNIVHPPNQMLVTLVSSPSVSSKKEIASWNTCTGDTVLGGTNGGNQSAGAFLITQGICPGQAETIVLRKSGGLFGWSMVDAYNFDLQNFWRIWGGKNVVIQWVSDNAQSVSYPPACSSPCVPMGSTPVDRFAPNEAWTSQPVVGSGDTPFFADVNGDGKQDLIIVNSSTVNVLLGNSNGSGFLAPIDFTGGPFFGSNGTFFADVDGDGLADAIAVNTRTVFIPKLGRRIVRDIAVRRSIWTSFSPTIEAWGGTLAGSMGIFFADVNHDGKADAILVDSATVTVMLSNGNSFGAEQDWTSGPFFGTRGTFFADVDGDGQADAIEVNDSTATVNSNTVTVRRSNGFSFGPPEDWTGGPFFGSKGTFFADVDGDGRADAIAVNDNTTVSNTTTVRRADKNGGHFFGPNEDWTGGPYFGDLFTMFADANGDHRADAIVFNTGSPMIVRRAIVYP